MSQDFLIACANGVLPVDNAWLESISLYFKNQVESEMGDDIFSDLTFQIEEVKLAFFICRESLPPDRRCQQDYKQEVTLDKILAEKKTLLSSLAFLDKYLFDKELVYDFFLYFNSTDRSEGVIKRENSIKRLRSVRAFFHEKENHTPYSKELVFRASERIEFFMLELLLEARSDIERLKRDVDLMRVELDAVERRNRTFYHGPDPNFPPPYRPYPDPYRGLPGPPGPPQGGYPNPLDD